MSATTTTTTTTTTTSTLSAFEQAKVNFRTFYDDTARERSHVIANACAVERDGGDASALRERAAFLAGRMVSFQDGLLALAFVERESRKG